VAEGIGSEPAGDAGFFFGMCQGLSDTFHRPAVEGDDEIVDR